MDRQPDTEPPPISVVVPTRDRPQLLARALRAIVDQDYPGDIECLVVFDGPVRPLPDMHLGDRRSVVGLPNTCSGGLAGARNSGVAAARGELVAFCDDDDEWLASKLSRQVELLLRDPGCLAASCANIVVFRGREVLREAPSPRVTFADLLRSRVAVLHSSTIVVWRDAYRDVIGPVDEDIPAGASEDYEWQLRAARVAPIIVAPEALVRVHWHEGSNYARRWDLYIAGLAYILDKYPEFAHEPRGRARIEGQIAFGYAALGRTRESARWMWRCVRSDWRQPRGYLSVLVGARCVNVDGLMNALHARGKGI